MSDLHHEKHLEAYVVQKLAAAGWLVGASDAYDADRAMYPEDLEAWLRATQPKKWDRLQAMNGDKTLKVVMDRLETALEKQGMVQTLRRGFSIAGAGHLDLSEAAPEDRRNDAVLHRYASNRLRVVPQLKYHPGRELALDLGLFLNGLPLATVELKTDFTQSIEHAKAQYRRDRLPVDPVTKRKHPLLTFKRGAVVHFAMSDSEIWMTTRLAGEDTVFLPFNKGNEGRAGNPPRADGEYPVAYFWEEICHPDAFLRIFHSFVYVEKKDVVDLKGNWTVKETLIFPRFHQFDAVNKMIADAKEQGPGFPYLCEHSAGSGKTSTIAWTAHDLVKLRRDDGTPIFDTVIIVTDRNVLDGQLQDAVQQIDHQKGLIAAIDRETSSKSKSEQLSEAMLKGTPIIVVTIQTFPFAMEAILTENSLRDRNFAVIIDEAHNSQTGNTASKLQATLALSARKDAEEMTVEDILLEIQRARKRPSNVSHFAFTATPKHSTMMLFGRLGDPTRPASDDNLPVSFHKYEMRQAIEEEFILDVLRGYVPYKTAFNLGQEIVEEKRVDGKAAKRALAKWMTLHPTNVTQKVRFIIEHFSRNVAHLLDGKAKAMVVTSSRASAVRYKRAFDAYIAANPEYQNIRALVAFSGKLTGREVMHPNDDLLEGDAFVVEEDAEFTEANMNPDAGGKDLRHVFDRPEYRVMLVANKFQTGFDQPKLVAMYVDKKIANAVEIVQTFSRLNRTFPGKDQTFIIDFVNDPDAVRAAFARYDRGARIEEVQDLNVIYDLKEFLDDQGVYDETHVRDFQSARFRTATAAATGKDDEAAHKAMYAATQEPTDAYNRRLSELRERATAAEDAWQRAKNAGNEDGMKRADHEREQVEAAIAGLTDFKSGLSRFGRLYAYIAQLVDLGDPDLETFAAFSKLLANRLDGVPPTEIDLHGIALTGYDIAERETTSEGEHDEPPTLDPVKGGGGGSRPGALPVYMQELIEQLNSLFGEATPLEDQVAFVNQVAAITRENPVVMAQIDKNSKDQAMKGNLPGAVQAAVVRAMSSHSALATLLLSKDRQALPVLEGVIYEILKRGEELSVHDQ
ncbi:type I restriction endonuclease subunit R [Roseovarius gahaiensis]|uniref:Type I restriction endonuclease subunit R n=1 Tax=Roseovarius gahaiensis TaxID=2716691 RepID=A0A967BEQ5_9RHOB|nr:DEAD/DEAH box helicase family protein [Roseovarius gahaiensis]NHQ74576.1 type I restriction endonuclease subunit R [Roseovarius gahaiensis]